LKKRLIIFVFLAFLAGVGTLVYLGQYRERTTESYYSGTVEAIQAELAFQVSGKVNKVLVDEGQPVEEDQILAELDQAEFLARKNQAQASLMALKSKLTELEKGYRAQEVEQARLASYTARINLEEARKDKVRFDTLYEKRTISEKERDVAELKYETALKEYQRSKQAFDLLREGFRKEDIEAARAQAEAAESALELTEIQLKNAQLRAPFKGIITSRNVEPGEVVSPGREVLSLSDLSNVDLKVFVDETEIGKVKPGQEVQVKIDTFPQKVYIGHISYISPEAEFTPKIIQTHKERVKLVYMVKISIPNPDLELKSGMPADAWFR
jgi:HlyD family secretion protein